MWLVATNCHSSFRGMNLKVWGILLADLITGSQIKKKKEKNEDEVWRVEPEAER